MRLNIGIEGSFIQFVELKLPKKVRSEETLKLHKHVLHTLISYILFFNILQKGNFFKIETLSKFKSRKSFRARSKRHLWLKLRIKFIKCFLRYHKSLKCDATSVKVFHI